MIRLLAAASALAGSVVVLAACGGSDGAPVTTAAQGGSPSASGSSLAVARAGDGAASLRVGAPGARRVDAVVSYVQPGVRGGGASVRGSSAVRDGSATIPLGALPGGNYAVAITRTMEDGSTQESTRRISLGPTDIGNEARGDNVFAPGVQEKLALKSGIETKDCNANSDFDEFICMRISNYMLDWKPSTDGKPPLLGDGSTAWLEGNAVQGDWYDEGGSGRYHSGPPGTWVKDWTTKRGKWQGLSFAQTRWEINFDDDGDNEVSGRVFLDVAAGDVRLGRVQLDAYNEGQESKGISKCLEGGSWSRFVTCSFDGMSHTPQEGSADYEDEMVFGYYLQSFPVRVQVSNRLPNARLRIEAVTTPGTFVADPRASTLKADVALDNLDAPEQVQPPRITTLQGQPVTIPAAGQAIKCLPGQWTGRPALTRTWSADDAPIPGATGEVLKLGSDLVGKVVGCSVVATNAKGSVTVRAEDVGPVAEAPAGSGADAATESTGAGSDGPAPAAEAPPTAWLVGWRTFNASESITIRGRLTSLSEPPEKGPWVGAPVTITIALASSGTGPPPEPPKDGASVSSAARWSSCSIGKSSETGSKAECVIDAASPGGPGSLNEVTVEIRR